MRITKDQPIEGLPAEQARRLMRAYFDRSSAWPASEILDVSEPDAVAVLQGVIAGARAYNADPDKLLTVAQLTVFGSYLDPEQNTPGDLDLGIKVVRRVSNNE